MKEEQLRLLLLISFATKGYEAQESKGSDENLICKDLIKSGYAIQNKDTTYSITEKGKELIKALLITPNFFETQHEIKEEAKDMMKKAKDKYNTLLDNLKI